MSKFNPKSPYLIFTAVLLAVIGGVFLILYFAGVFATPAAGEPPVAYWRFDEGYGGTAYDDSTNNNDGTIYGATWQSEDMCKSGKCLRFNGGGDKVSVSSTIIPSLQTFTISMWVKPGPVPGSSYPIFFTSKGQYLYLAYHHSDDRFRLSWLDSGGTQRHVNVYGFSDENQWYYITAVLTASSQKLYVNGLEKGSASYTGFESTAMTGADLGYYSYSSSYPFLGYLDDIRIYNYVRTPEQIKADYLGGGPKGSAIKVSLPSEVYNLNQGLVGYWKMDETSWNGTSGEVKDSSGNNNHGTAAGNALPVAGKFGNGGTFDGSGDYVNISNFNIGDTITLSAWLKSSAYDGKIPLSLDGNNYSSGPNIYFAGGKILWNTGDSTNNPFYNGYPDANWHHFVVVNDYANNYAKLFIDGVEKGTAGYRNSTTTNGVFRIGDFHGGSYSFNGLIDDVRIYNRALNNREIRALYEWGPPPVGYWKMDERVAGDNKTIYDISGNGNNGTTHYGANAMGMDCTKPGKYGTACFLDGVDDYVIKNPISNFPKSAITTTFWIKTSDSNDGIISYASTASDNNWLIFNSANIQIYTVTSNVTTGVSINDNKWHFIAVTWNGTDGATKLYKDGKLSYSGTLASGGSITANGSLVIGVDQDSVGGGFEASDFFNGTIDDVRIYNYARTPEQILEDYNSGAIRIGI